MIIMLRAKAAALAPAFLLLLATAAPTAAGAATGFAERAVPIPVRQVCDADGRCYETGDPGDRDDGGPPPHRRFDPDDDDRRPPPRRRYDPDDDDRPPPPRHRYDRDDDDRPPPPPRHRYDRDDDN